MISSTTWVARGFASEFPEKYELDDEEMERINQLAQLNLDDARAVSYTHLDVYKRQS